MGKLLIIMRGLPGSGKSTLARHLFPQRVFEADDYFYDHKGNYTFDATQLNDAHKWCQSRVKEAMDINKETNEEEYSEIVVSNTSTTEKELQPYLDLACEYGYQVVSLIVENRHGSKSVHNVPDNTIERMKQRFSIKL